MDTEDRISSLPDCLLLDIISRIEYRYYLEKEEDRLMSTKEVIKTTSTISKRWQHLWTLLPNLTFIDVDDITRQLYYGVLGRDHTKYFSCIDKTLTKCPTDVKLNKFKLHIHYDSEINTRPTSQVNSWIRHAITRNVQKVDLKIRGKRWILGDERFSYDNELLFNNSCITSMRISDCSFNPPNGVIRWDKLKFLCISKGELDNDIVGKILSGSPCLETLELNKCYAVRRNLKSLFENFVVIRLICDIETYKRFSYDRDDNERMRMKHLRCEFSPPNVAIRWDKLKFLCISKGELDEDSIGKILSGSPCLETLELESLDCCYGVRRIDVTSKRFKNLVLTNFGTSHVGADYIDTIEINAPYMLSLTIKGKLYLEKLLLLNVSSLVKADFNYLGSNNIARRKLGRDRDDIEEELLRGLLSSLGHVNDITLGYYCLDALSRLRNKGFQFFRVGADGDEDRVTELIASGRKKLAAERKKLAVAAERKKLAVAAAAKTKKKEKVEAKGESDDDMGLMSLFD